MVRLVWFVCCGDLMKYIFFSLVQFFVRRYIHLYIMLNRFFCIHLRGLGFVLRLLRQEYVLYVHSFKFWFNPKCAAAYCILPGGYWNEPETHLFLDNILAKVTGDVAFIDVGASVGEMVIPMAKNKKVFRVIAFEPQVQCALAIEKSAKLNDLKNVFVVPCAASEKNGFIGFKSSLQKPTAASISFSNEAINPFDVPCVTVDETILPDKNLSTIMLIDAEGHEPSVMRGAVKLVNKALPLIIFEYINPPAKYFSLEDIHNILPDSYQFYRLRGDGKLDVDFSNSWNIVAVSANTEFAKICADLITR